VRGRLDLAVTDLGLTQLKNIAEPVRIYSLQVGMRASAKSATTPEQPAPAEPIKRFAPALVGGVLLIAVVTLARHYVGASQMASVAPERSIVVLPLTNLSGDAGQDYLVDALTDELTTSISRLPGTFVIARNTAFTFRGKPTDVKAIGKDLGVKYVLEGSVQPTASRIRVNTQLIDAESAAHLWAESFDEDRGDLLAMEDDIVTRLARTLDIQLTDVEAAKAGQLRPDNPDAEDLALRCLAAYNDNYAEAQDPVKHSQIFASCEQALRLDPRNARALSILAERMWGLIAYGVDTTDELKRFDELVPNALMANPNDANARAANATLTRIHGRYDETIVESKRAIALNPSNISAYYMLGNALFLTGQEEEAIAIFDKAMRLSPRDPSLTFLLFDKALALLVLERDAEASAVLNQALTLAPNNRQLLRTQAATLANLGRVGEARELYQRYAALTGGKLATVAQYKAFVTRVTAANIPIIVAWRERMFAGLRKVGMPEE
jgi:TolB-like protein/Flp pilus assembly protein TadD